MYRDLLTSPRSKSIFSTIFSDSVRVTLIIETNFYINYISKVEKTVGDFINNRSRRRNDTSDHTTVSRILIGSTKYVYRVLGPEIFWKNKVLTTKTSDENMAQTLGYYSDLSIFTQKDLMSKYNTQVARDINDDYINKSTVSKLFKKTDRLNITKKLTEDDLPNGPGRPGTDKRERSPGRQQFYVKVNYQDLKRVLSNNTYLGLIFYYLRDADVLQQWFKFNYYRDFISDKYRPIDDLIRIDSARRVLSEGDLEIIKSKHIKEKEVIKKWNLTDQKLMAIASQEAKKHIALEEWRTDHLYKQLYREGYRVYEIPEFTNTTTETTDS